MFQDVKNELRVLKHENFTGHVKFGIEKGRIVSLSHNNRFMPDDKTCDFSELEKIYCDDFWGVIEIDIVNGAVVNVFWMQNFKDDNLKQRLEKNKCRYVKFVEKK